MNAMVVGVFALASALVREDAFRDWTARVEESRSSVMPRVVDGDVDEQPTVVASEGSASGAAQSEQTGQAAAVSPASSASADDTQGASDNGSADDPPAGSQWQIACEIKSGSALVFDRASLREYGTMTLFRWSAPHARIAGPGDQIFTAVVNCREKSIEAAWPGRRRETYAGTCGRGLVEAVCAASEQASAAPASARGRSSGVRHAGGTTPRR
jgi:hypothetical protein